MKPKPQKYPVPNEIMGNWFNEKSGDWEFSFFDTLAIYKRQLWNYAEIKLTNKDGFVALKNKTSTVKLILKDYQKGTCLAGESSKTLLKYCNDASKLKINKLQNDQPFVAPVFKRDTVTLCGYIKDYTPRMKSKTGTIYVNDILTGEQNSHLIKISDSGYFSVKLPIYYPHEVFVRSSAYNGSFFLEPGKELFLLIDLNYKNNILFMGEGARINKELSELRKIDSFDYNKMMDSILNMTPDKYKTYCLELKQKELAALETYSQKNLLSSGAYQVKKLSIDYRYSCNIMEYNWNYEGAYRKKNNVPRTERTLPIKIDKLTPAYFNFISNEIANNPLAVLSNDYYYFINRLKYLDILRETDVKGFTELEITDELQKKGYILSDKEKEWIAAIKERDAKLKNVADDDFEEKYKEKYMEFFRKYSQKLQELYKEKKGDEITASEIEKFLIEKEVKFTEEDKLLLDALKKSENTEASKIRKQHNALYKQIRKDFFNTYQKFISEMYKQRNKRLRNEKFQNILGIQPGFAIDIMTAQDECRQIVAEVTPVSDSTLLSIQQQISTPFIAEYIASCNKATRAKIEANKSNTGYTVNEIPKTEADQLFDSIMSKYNGKAVYVDFWATWCGPCRSGIEQIKPLKEELTNTDVVFVYITNQTSPKNTWENMIPDIKGEHYRVSEDQWNYLKSKFNITGIPHIVLVNKKGEVVNPHLSFMDNDELKKELLKLASDQK